MPSSVVLAVVAAAAEFAAGAFIVDAIISGVVALTGSLVLGGISRELPKKPQ